MPMIRFPGSMTAFTSNAASVPTFGAPTIPQVPRIPSASTACLRTSGRPLLSSVKSAPPPVISCAAATGSVSRLFTTCVAPSSFGQVKAARRYIDGDDPGRACKTRRHHGAETDGPCAEHSEAGACGYFERIEHRTGAGLDSAAERAEQLKGRFLGNLHDVALVGHCIGAKRGLTKEMVVQCVPMAVVARSRAVRSTTREIERGKILAMCRVPFLA
jgi:hypothetical protein